MNKKILPVLITLFSVSLAATLHAEPVERPNPAHMPQDAGFNSLNRNVVQNDNLRFAHNRLQAQRNPDFPWDVNGDNQVNIVDLVTVAQKFGEVGEVGSADINGDGGVDIVDLVLVAQHFGEEIPASREGEKVAGAGRWEVGQVREILYGDVDGDGEINFFDFFLADSAVKESIPLNQGEEIRADVDGDGKVTGEDATLIRQKSVDPAVVFPVEKIAAAVPPAAAITEKPDRVIQDKNTLIRLIPSTENWVVTVAFKGEENVWVPWQNGELRKGDADAVLYLDNLKSGEYVVTLIMTDEFGRQSQTTVVFTVKR